jgi:hypothetical protein
MPRDSLVCGFEHIPMGALTERDQPALGVTRHDQDTLAAESHSRAVAAIKDGRDRRLRHGRRPGLLSHAPARQRHQGRLAPR